MAILDVDRLAAPIPGESPSGVDLRAEAPDVFSEIRSARGAAIEAVAARQSGAESDVDWRPLLARIPEILETRSKSLELVAWLLEALVHEHGFEGLHEGLRLARRLVEEHWETLYPAIDEYGVETRVQRFSNLNGSDSEPGTLVRAIDGVPLTERTSDGGPHARWHYLEAREMAGVEDDFGDDFVSLATLERVERATSPVFAQALHEIIGACRQEFDLLVEALEVRCGRDDDGVSRAPGSSQISAALQDCEGIVGKMAGATAGGGGPEAPSTDQELADSSSGSSGSSGFSSPGGPITSRAEAFAKLLEVARYFKMAEPHSPVSYALERIVRWGNLTLPELLAELISDAGPRDEVFKLVGIDPPEDS